MVQTNPTPFDVGRAFVHQYYTLLHRAPELLHRFYSTDSTFIHGGVDRPGSVEQPAVGPENISKRIIELNLRDCHAKIRQVDSHPTIGNGVVVQVTGELSNNGHAMRRFMQTFVLAPREPKKYYVQNDIFRYQDEVFDEGSDEDDRSSSQVYNDTDKVSNADSSVMANPPAPIEVQHQPLPQRRAVEPQPVVDVPVTFPAEVSSSDGGAVNQNQPSKSANLEGSAGPTPLSSASYAGIAKLTASAGPASSPTPVASTVTPTPPPTAAAAAATATRPAPTGNRGYSSQRGNTEGYRGMNPRAHQWGEQSDGGYRPTNPSHVPFAAPNDQQVFVGSLPSNITREELMQCFAEYGNVVDAKINAFPQDYKKNYGFVVFDDAATAAQVVQLQHVTYKEHRLNVEPKTQKVYGNNPNNLRHNHYSARGGGGRGMNRGGYRGAPGGNLRRGGGGYRYDNVEENHPKEPSQT